MQIFRTVQSLFGRIDFRHLSYPIFISCVFIAFGLFPRGANASVYAELSISPVYEKANASLRPSGGSWQNEGAVGTSTKLGYDLRATLGLALFDTLFIGGSANSFSTNLTRPAVGDDTNKAVSDSRLEYGPSVGLVWGGFHLIGTYFLEASRVQNVNERDANGALVSQTEATDKEAHGFQASIGYTFQVMSGWRIGPSLIYREISYDKQSLTNSVTPASSYKDRTYLSKPVEAALTPFLTFRFEF